MRIRLKQELCVGAGLCVLSSAEVFDQRDEDGLVELRPGQENPAPHLHDAVRGAARKCPALAIVIEDEAG